MDKKRKEYFYSLMHDIIKVIICLVIVTIFLLTFYTIYEFMVSKYSVGLFKQEVKKIIKVGKVQSFPLNY